MKENKNDFLQLFVLTHSLYFFHELLKQYKNVNLFRLTKSKDKGTQIIKMEKNEIQNDYQSFWQIIKDYKNDPKIHNEFLLANAMRNILEHFFGFMFKATLRSILDKSAPAFLRYMNRESHSDATNISDIKEINANLFLGEFKKVFEANNYKKHYDKMVEVNLKN